MTQKMFDHAVFQIVLLVMFRATKMAFYKKLDILKNKVIRHLTLEPSTDFFLVHYNNPNFILI